jgi:hypothetical protein
VHLHLGAALGADLGTLAGPTAGAGVVLAVSHGPLRLEVQGTTWASRFVAARTSPGSGGVLGFESVAFRLCLDKRWSAVSLGGCGGGEAILAHGQGVGVARPASDRSAWSVLEAGAWVRQLSASALSVYGGLAAGVPLRRPEADIAGIGAIYRPWAVTGLACLGVDLRLF